MKYILRRKIEYILNDKRMLLLIGVLLLCSVAIAVRSI